MTGSTSGAGSSELPWKGGGGSGGRRGAKRSVSVAMAGLGRVSSDDGKHLWCREFRLYREGWWGVWGEEGGKKVGLDCYGRFSSDL